MATWPNHGEQPWDEDLKAYVDTLPSTAGPFLDALIATIDGRAARRSNNLSDLADAPIARGNLGLGTSAVEPSTTIKVGPSNGINDTAKVQAALAAMVTGSAVEFTAGQTYNVSNLVIPDLADLTLIGNGATIRSNGTGDAAYLIAAYNWVNNVATPGAQRCTIQGLIVVASSTGLPTDKVNGIVHQSSRFKMFGCDVSLASGACVRQDAQTKNGTDVGNNIVECEYRFNRLHDSGYGFLSNDPTTYRNTDGVLFDNKIFNSTVSNIKIDKLSGWHLLYNHTYQYGGSGTGAAFTPGTNWDLDVTDVGVGAFIIGNYFESGCVRIKALTQLHTPIISDNHFGLTAPSGAVVSIATTVTGGNNAAVSLVNCHFYGPTSAGNYTTLSIAGPSTGDPLRVHLTGCVYGFRNPISWSGQVKVFNENCSILQVSQKVPPDLIVTGFMPTSGTRPPGIVYRTAVPSSTNETYVVGDRWVNTAPSVLGSASSQYTLEGGVCVTAGSPGTWADRRILTGT